MTNLDPKKKLKPAIARYREEIATARDQGAINEGHLSHAFANLLRKLAPLVGWEFLEQAGTESGKAFRFDGELKKNAINRGVWEAKDVKDNLAAEITKKIARGYPLRNTLFEDTRQAILYQNGQKVRDQPFDLQDDDQFAEVLRRFLSHTDPHYEEFDAAVIGFGDRVRSLCTDLKAVIAAAHAKSKTFQNVFATFADLCRASINPGLSDDDVDNLLIQHLLIHRLIEKVFASGFFRENAIAREIDTVLTALTGAGFDRDKFYHDLNPFYEAIEGAAKDVGSGPDAWTRKQGLLNDVYERFFQKYDPAVADTHGIVYTPQAIVDFMCASVEEVLKTEFGLSLGHPAVQILDPCTGTGNFVVNLLKRIPRESLADAYKNRLFANEIQLLPYYIAALNIEHAYYELMGKYEAFPGLCFVDTLELVEHRQPTLGFMTPENTERVQRQVDAPITVIVGNPPYNVGQKDENDNNKNRVYRRKSKSDPEGVDDRVSATYARDSRATNKNALSDVFVKFFRWASDRLGRRDGIVCFVTNNAFVDNISYDGMRRHLGQDFDLIYHLDCRGNVRQNPKLSGTAYNVFGIQVGVGITLAVRCRSERQRSLYYHQLDLGQKRQSKLASLGKFMSYSSVGWQELVPDSNNNWLVPIRGDEFSNFLSIGNRETKSSDENTRGLFKIYGCGVKSNKDDTVYDFDFNRCKDKSIKFSDHYNFEVFRYAKAAKTSKIDVDSFVNYENMKWSRDLKQDLVRGNEIDYSDHKLRTSLYRPFTKKHLFFDRIANEGRVLKLLNGWKRQPFLE